MARLCKIAIILYLLLQTHGYGVAQQTQLHEDLQPETTSALVLLAEKTMAAAQSQHMTSIISSEERLIDAAITEFDAKTIRSILDRKSRELNFRDIYNQTINGIEKADESAAFSSEEWLVDCVENSDILRAHKCSVSLGFLAILNSDTDSTLDWSLKSLDIANSMEKSDDNYWYLQYQSYELLNLAFIFDGNVEGAINSGNRFVESTLQANVKVPTYHFINNLSYLARNEIDPEAALKILETVVPTLETLPAEDREIMYYALGKSNTLVGDYESGQKYYDKLGAIVKRSDVRRAYFANTAFVKSKLGKNVEALSMAKQARILLENELVNDFGVNILKAEKNVAIARGNLEDALKIDEQLDEVKEEINAKSLSANRRKLSKSLQIQNEKNERERDKLEFQAELASQKADARNTQLMLAFVALSFLLGLLTYMFRSYRREQKLNSEIQVKNDELEVVNKDLNEANQDLKRTFDRLKIAHRQAMAGQDAKQKFIGVVGHELRTPLNPIINLAEILEGKARDPKERSLLKAIKNAGKRLHIIVENMLAISSADDDSRVYIEMVDVVNETKMIIEEFVPNMNDRNRELKAKGLFLNVNVYKHPELKRDQVSNKIIYRSIIRNLFDNAMKFTPHGEISIHLQPRKGHQGFHLEIRDTGLGMDALKINSFMRPFEQAEMGLGRSHEGAGLGLAVVQKYCEQLGAKMDIKSTVGQGTRISIDFPEPAHESDTGKLLKVA